MACRPEPTGADWADMVDPVALVLHARPAAGTEIIAFQPLFAQPFNHLDPAGHGQGIPPEIRIMAELLAAIGRPANAPSENKSQYPAHPLRQ